MKKLALVTAISTVLLMSGCASTSNQGSSLQQEYQAELEARDNEIDQLKQKLNDNYEMASAQTSGSMVTASTSSQQQQNSSDTYNSDLLPPNAKSGQCFARVYTPPTYKTETENVLKAEGYDVVEIIPAEYGVEQKTVMTQEETEVLAVIPAVYGWKEESILISPAITELRKVPAMYNTEYEQRLVKPAHSIWKKGTGPITKIDQSTGEIMCRVEVPAVYETVTKRVLVSPETTESVVVKAAVYKTVKTRVVEQAAKTTTRTIPAVYDTVSVQKLVKDSTTRSTTIPATYKTVETTVKVDDGYLEWAPVLCETNVTGDIVRQLQKALNDKDYSAGPEDGVYGWQTTNAVRQYQSDNELAGDGQLTIALVEKLELNY